MRRPPLAHNPQDLLLNKDNHQRLQSNARKLYARFAISIAAILLFIAISVNAHLIAATGQIPMASVALLAVALFSLPRYTRAGIFVPVGDEPAVDEPKEDKLLRVRLAKLAELATFLRIAYLAIVLGCYMGLPLLAPAPS